MNSPLHDIVTNSPRLMPRTKTIYIAACDRWIEFAGPDPSNWTRPRCAMFYRELIGTMKVKSANTVLAGVQYAAKWWANNQNRPDLDFGQIERGKAEVSAQRQVLSPDQAIALLNTTLHGTPIDLRDRALMILALETGMRAMSLHGCHLDAFRSDDYPRIAVPLKGRGTQPFDVPLTETALVGLEPWRAWLKSNRVSKGPLFRRLNPRLTERGLRRYEIDEKAISTVTIYNVVRVRALDANIGHVHPHVFRHTFITSRTGPLTPIQIASITGHAVQKFGEMGGYMNLHEIGREARKYSPDWLAAWCQGACR